jgi:hypothetical protein
MLNSAVVIIGDVCGSRKMAQDARYEGQLYLKSAIIQINEKKADIIEAPFMLTRGDEFQGVLPDLKNAFEVMLEFERLLFPLQIRYGIGLGPIQKMGSTIPVEMDGPAFHRASEALSLLKRKKQITCCKTNNETSDLLINTILNLMNAIKGRWNVLTFNRYWKYKEFGTLEKVAIDEKVSAQAVWDSMHNMRIMEILEAEDNLLLYLASINLLPVDLNTNPADL